ncbi:nuclease-related domain-containing protein [Streptomyces sp. DH12]|uniref:nuclease-related domain-containing protein n=1 Tax=Streptomyces sp. DH12 TaxID=2857010 RepID=UPI001E2B80EE|nr:nuclease-related domain-containing protein [Streptomyces sp. DH12]
MCSTTPDPGRAGRSASAWADQARQEARRGVWRRLLAALGLNPAARRADAAAARRHLGAAGEQATAALLDPLIRDGWYVRHDLALPGSQANLDHVLVAPTGTAMVVVDTKQWHRSRPTTLVRGRVHCGEQDRHGQVEAVARYAARAADAVGLPRTAVWPLLVVHGSPIPGGRLEAQAAAWDGVVHVLGPEWLVPTLRAAPRRRDPARAADLVRRVDRVLLPYGL